LGPGGFHSGAGGNGSRQLLLSSEGAGVHGSSIVSVMVGSADPGVEAVRGVGGGEGSLTSTGVATGTTVASAATATPMGAEDMASTGGADPSLGATTPPCTADAASSPPAIVSDTVTASSDLAASPAA
jgi:hypothetical protein